MATTEGTAATGGLTLDQVNAAVAKALEPILGSLKTQSEAMAGLVQNQKVLADTLQKLPPAAKQEDPKAQTAADVQKAIADAIGAQAAQQQTTQQRQQFIAANLGKLPAAYQGQLGSDPAKWAEEAKTIQAAFENDFKTAGGKPETIGGATKDGGTTAAKTPADLSKVPAFERLNLGLSKLQPVAPAQAVTSGGAAG